MSYKSRVLVVLLMPALIAVGCSRTTRGEQVSQQPSPPPATASTPTASVEATPIPGHPPITTTGVVAKVDPAAGVLVFQDGRMVKLTEQSKVLVPVDVSAVRPSTPVVVRNAMPVAVKSAKAPMSATRQKMGTVAAVDQQDQLVRLTDGSAVRVSPSTNMHMGTEGKTIVLTELRPGDELVIVMAEAPPSASGTPSAAGAQPAPGAAPGGARSTADPSALPRTGLTQAPSDPSDAVELMVFRETQAP
jgi:hypothetical protein